MLRYLPIFTTVVEEPVTEVVVPWQLQVSFFAAGAVKINEQSSSAHIVLQERSISFSELHIGLHGKSFQMASQNEKWRRRCFAAMALFLESSLGNPCARM